MLSFHEIKQVLNVSTPAQPTDDFRILDSWSEFDGDGDIKSKKLKYLCYQFEALRSGNRQKNKTI